MVPSSAVWCCQGVGEPAQFCRQEVRVRVEHERRLPASHVLYPQKVRASREGDFPELGYFTLSQLMSIRGPMGLKVERDLYFGKHSLAEVMEKSL